MEAERASLGEPGDKRQAGRRAKKSKAGRVDCRRIQRHRVVSSGDLALMPDSDDNGPVQTLESKVLTVLSFDQANYFVRICASVIAANQE